MSVDSEVQVKYLEFEAIEKEANEFRFKYQAKGDCPVPIMDIVQFDLGISIIPVFGLESKCNTYSLITSSWEYIYVDNERYLDRFQAYDKKINFSVAHEIGHYVLHSDTYNKLGIEGVDDFYKYFEGMSEGTYKRLELQANMFAGKLLVPADILQKEINNCYEEIKNGQIDVQNFGEQLSDKFQVSSDVIVRRVVIENLKIPDQVRNYFNQ